MEGLYRNEGPFFCQAVRGSSSCSLSLADDSREDTFHFLPASCRSGTEYFNEFKI